MRGGRWRQPDGLPGPGPHRAGVRAHRGVQHVGQEDVREVSRHAALASGGKFKLKLEISQHYWQI